MTIGRLLVVGLLAGGLAAGAAGCGDDDGPPVVMPDGGPDDQPDGGPDVTPTFTTYVIDLIENQTADDTEPAAVDFDLADPDGDLQNLDAFNDLF